MKKFVTGLGVIFVRKDSVIICILSACIFFLLFLGIQNGSASLDIAGFSTLGLFTRLSLMVRTFFDITNSFTVSALILGILGSLIGGVNLSLAYTYMKLRGEVIVKSGLYSGVGLVLAFLGIGCAACGTVLLGTLFSFFGASSLLTLLPYRGVEIGYIGVFILCIATYVLSHKVTNHNLC